MVTCSTVGEHLGGTFLEGGVPLVAVLTGIAALALKSLFQCLKVKKFAKYNIKNPSPQLPCTSPDSYLGLCI